MWPTHFFFTKFKYRYQNNPEFYEKCKKPTNKKLLEKQVFKLQNWILSSSILLSCKNFWQFTFLSALFSNYFN
jgi:hypothetical protein